MDELTTMNADPLVLNLERAFMSGSTQWVADFTESYRNVKVRDTIFDAILRGDIRPKGFVFARIIAFFLVPNYYVAAFILRLSPRSLRSGVLRGLVNTIRGYMKDEELKWSWLTIVVDEEPPNQILKTIEELNLEDVGVLLLEEPTRQCTRSRGLLGEHLYKSVIKGLKEQNKYKPKAPSFGRISPTNISKVAFFACSLFLLTFLGIAVVTGYFPMILAPIIIPVSILFGLLIYYSRMHMALTFDSESFLLKEGRTTLAKGEWRSVEDVSIIRQGLNSFYLALKPKDSSALAKIPTTSLKIDPFAFRLTVLELLRKHE